MDAFRPALPAAAVVAGLLLLLNSPAAAQSDVLLQLESGSPASDRFVVDSAGGFVARGALHQGSIPATGAGARLMWYPAKAAFRVGRVEGTQWDDASVGFYSTAVGFNTVASSFASTAMGGNTRASGPYSTAIGHTASTNDFAGSFVYGDLSTFDTVHASYWNQATWRTVGGFRIFTNLDLTSGCSIGLGGIAWECTSSRLAKENFAAVDGEDILWRLRAVPVTSWNVIGAGPGVRHVGPMAQDWNAAFGLNDDPLTIHQGDLAGVTLAAVQALDGRTRGVPEMEERIRQLEVENAAVIREAASLRREAAEQRARLERLEARLAAEP
jgi:hypothetical protein